jgi:hypothetical protein
MCQYVDAHMDLTMIFFYIYIVPVYYFECLYDVIYKVENALCDINKHHLQLR